MNIARFLSKERFRKERCSTQVSHSGNGSGPRPTHRCCKVGVFRIHTITTRYKITSIRNINLKEVEIELIVNTIDFLMKKEESRIFPSKYQELQRLRSRLVRSVDE